MMHTHWLVAASTVALITLSGCGTVTDKWQQFRGQKNEVTSQLAEPKQLRPTQDTGRWTGFYTLDADTGRFQECETGQTLSVMMGGDSALLEGAYMASRLGLTQPMLATLDGKIVQQPPLDPIAAKQGLTELHVLVERFVSLSSAANCAKGKAVALGNETIAVHANETKETVPQNVAVDSLSSDQSASESQAAKTSPQSVLKDANAAIPLHGTYWRLIEIAGQAVVPTETEPHIVLHKPAKLVGSSGCNRLLGDWVQNGDSLLVSKVATTRKACKPALAKVERSLLAALSATRLWSVNGSELILSNPKKQVLARFQAVALR